MKILGYRGTSITSHLIKLQTRSIYSHVGVQLSDGSVVEAWQGTGVRQIETPFIGHASNTLIDVYSITQEFDEAAATKYLLEQIGQAYDYKSVWRFLSRRSVVTDDRKFCSELAEEAMIEAGLPLLNGNPSEHSPRDTVLSPYLKLIETIWLDK